MSFNIEIRLPHNTVKDRNNSGIALDPLAHRTLLSETRLCEQGSYTLTPHQVRLLKLIVNGHSYKTAAAALGVTPHTISFHLRSIYEKLQVHTKSEAVSKALRSRLVE